MHIVDRLNRACARPLTESGAHDLAVKLLKQHNLVPDGADPRKMVKGIARQHGIPATLVPQVVHGIAHDQAARDEDARYHDMGPNKPPGHLGVASWVEHRRQARDLYVHALGAYAAPTGERVDEDTRRSVEYHVDKTRNWHEICTHHDKHRLVDVAVCDHFGRYADRDSMADAPEDVARDHAEEHMDARVRTAQHNFGGAAKTEGANSRKDYDDFHDRVADYNPLDKPTWRPLHPAFDGLAAGSTLHKFSNQLSRHIDRVVANSRGLKIPFAPDAVHEVGGAKYHAYTLDTPEKANAGCWGNRWCISTGESASTMNKHYHGGEYKTTHVITKVAQTKSGPVEHPHVAYLPELLPGGEHADPEQAVRNSGNNAAVDGEAFQKIHPLLSKLDPRIDAVAAHYRNG